MTFPFPCRSALLVAAAACASFLLSSYSILPSCDAFATTTTTTNNRNRNAVVHNPSSADDDSSTTTTMPRNNCRQRRPRVDRGRMHSPTPLRAVVTKRQTLILDGAELSYYIKSIAAQTIGHHHHHHHGSHDHHHTQGAVSGTGGGGNAIIIPDDVAPRAPRKRNRVGAITFVTATLEEDVNRKDGTLWLERGANVIGVEEVSSSSFDGTTDADNGESSSSSSSSDVVAMGGSLKLHRDSIARIPPNLSPVDAISTAAISLLGVHGSRSSSSLPTTLEQRKKRGGKKVVIVGGGEYALFLAEAFAGLGNRVSLVTARPTWSLPSSFDISPKNPNLVEIMPPAVGPMSLGFAMAIGEFEILVDTLGDEVGMGRALNVLDSMERGGRFLEQLKDLHGCDSYLSTLTRSQQYVLQKGLLFARDPVIRYQREVEEEKPTTTTTTTTTSRYRSLPPPSPGFGSTVQRLFDQNVIYPSGQNENGSHEGKSNFVRGWSLSDLTELKTWPREGPGRFGFPEVDLSVSSVSQRRKASGTTSPKKGTKKSVQADVTKTEGGSAAKQSATSEGPGKPERSDDDDNDDAGMMVTAPKSNANTTVKVTRRSSKAAAMPSPNPHVTVIRSAGDLNRLVVEPKRNCILFLTASYCQKCKQMTPHFNRIARMSSESASSSSDMLFAHADISGGPRGKQLGKVLNADKVPSVILFRDGRRVKAGGDDEEAGAAIVIERKNMKRLEEVAKALESGEHIIAKANALLTTSETVKK